MGLLQHAAALLFDQIQAGKQLRAQRLGFLAGFVRRLARPAGQLALVVDLVQKVVGAQVVRVDFSGGRQR